MLDDTVLTLARPRELPSPPAIMFRVVQIAADTQVSMERVARVVGSDPTFASELVRIANSPFYSSRAPVTTPIRAMVTLGLRTVRCIAIGFGAREVMRQSGFRVEDIGEFWEGSMRRAVAARRLAGRARLVDPEEAFTVGLLLEFGLLALFRAAPRRLPEWPALRLLWGDARLQRERELFGTTHDVAARELVDRWGLPSVFGTAVGGHHDAVPDGPLRATNGLTVIAQAADLLGALFATPRDLTLLNQARSLTSRAFGIDAAELDTTLQALAKEAEEGARALGAPIRCQVEWAELQSTTDPPTDPGLVRGARDDVNERLRRVVAEKEALQREVQVANERLAQMTYFDGLTGLSHRRRFDECLYAELHRVLRDTTPLSVVILDLDHFNTVNDGYGQVFGDTVLEAVGGVLRASTRAGDLKARIGGDELALILPGTTAIEAHALSDRIRARIASLNLRHGKQAVAVSASFGGTTARGPLPGGVSNVGGWGAALLDEADRALTAAKNGGRNRVVWAIEPVLLLP